jgi:hypothetical protein
MPKIIRNMIRCKNCGDIIESVHRYDFKWCKCGAVCIDGGKDYLKRGFMHKDDYEDLSIVEHK